MIAGPSACTCDQCGTTCTGKFAGCPEVWARGPQLQLVPPPARGGEGPRGSAPVPSSPPTASTVDGLRVEIEGLTRMMAVQQATIESLVARLLAREERRPAVAITADGEGPPPDVMTRMEQVSFDLGESVADTAVAISDLRAETQRVASVGQLAHSSLAVVRQIERTAARVDQRLDEFGASLAALRGRVDQLIRSQGASDVARGAMTPVGSSSATPPGSD
jgi:hypothetical protein